MRVMMARHVTHRRAPRFVAFVLAASVAGWTLPGDAEAGSLDRFEKAHRSKPSRDDDKDDDRSNDDDDDDRSYHGRYDDGYGDDEPVNVDGGSDGDAAVLLLAACIVPPFAFACFHPSFRPNRRPYGEGGLYLRPQKGRDGAAVGADAWYHPDDRAQFRWVELSLLGFRAFNEQAVYSHDLRLQGFLGMLTVRGSWEHFYEELDHGGGFDHLNFYRFHAGANVTGPFIDSVEWYLTAGALVMHGEDFTPAFEVGTELRAYPAEPLALHGAATLSFFELGPVLLDAHLHAGVTVGPLEVRAGPRVLYQGDDQGFWGPSATVVGRF
jgi:hypothetical protein